jgi:hypothetical protein
VTDETAISEIEQYQYDQSLANSDNTGMIAAVVGNTILLVAVILVIVFFLKRKKNV